MRNVRSIVCVLLLTLFGGLLFAQSDRATISGSVQDPTGAVLPDVQVQVTNVATNDVLTVKTSNAGLYTVKNLPVGSYTITFTKNGFRTLERKGITLVIGQEAGIDVKLQIGTQTESVVVTAEAPVLQTETPNLTTNIDAKAVNELPINVSGGRMLAKFMFNYVPGVEGDDYSSHINGSTTLSKEVMIDGISAVSQLGGYISETQPPMEGVQEFQVESAGISADAGRSGGGVFRYEMKSGTNQWHGSIVGFLRNKDLDAISANQHLNAQNNPNDAKAYLAKSATMSDWGVSGGGPIIKNKLFFYAAFERYMQSNWTLGAPGGTVPTDAMMGINPDGSWATYADLSSVAGAIYNPQTGLQYANNLIPTADISPVTKQILQLYHKYYQPEGAAGRIQNNAMPAATVPWNHIDETSVKLDYNISDKHRVNGSFIYNFTPRILADQGGIWSPVLPNGGPLANSYQHNTKSPSIRLSDSYNFSPNVINSFRFALNRFKNPSYATSQSGDWSNELGLGDGIGNFPKISFNNQGWYNNCCVAGYTGWNFSVLGSQFNDFYAANTFVYSDDVTWVKGRHTMKFGAEFRAMQFNSIGDSGVYNVTFDPQGSAKNAGDYNNSGSAWASFLLGNAASGGQSMPDNTYGRRKTFSVYGSDNIKVNSKLTVNIDLRWDYNSPFKEKFGHWSNFNIREKNPVTGLMGTMDYLTSGDQSFEKKQVWTNFAPHVGVAYAVTPKTVLRGTFSIFYVPLNMNDWAGVPYGFNPGFHDSSAAGAFNWNNGYVGTVTNVKKPEYTQWGMVYMDPRGLVPGNTQQLTFGVQQELTKDTKVDISFIRSNGYHLHNGMLETNQTNPADYQHFKATGQFPASYNGYYGYGNPWWAGLTPYPGAVATYWGPLFSVGAPLGNSDYKSLQVTFTKRASHGLSFLGSYNYSRSHGDADSGLNDLWWSGNIQNIYDLQSERKSISGYDMTHIVKGYVQYELPFGKGKLLGSNASTLVNHFIGGWNLDLGFHYNTGTPMQVFSNNGYEGFNAVYVNLVPGCSLTQGSRRIGAAFMNTACFQNPDKTTGALGTAGHFISGLRNAGMATEDLSLQKGVSFNNERYKLVLRADFFNVLNRHQLGSPVTDMNDPNYGKIINFGGLGGRQGQIGARFTF